MGPLLPFDTLLLSVSLQTRLLIAYATSMSYGTISHNHSKSNNTSSSMINHNNTTSTSPLRIGFMSYDFNDHPTAHLVEGIFDIVRKQVLQQEHSTHEYNFKYRLIIFSYGKDDGSTFRKQLEQVSLIQYTVSTNALFIYLFPFTNTNNNILFIHFFYDLHLSFQVST